MLVVIYGLQTQRDHQCHLERFLLVTRELMELGENFKVFYFNQTTDALIPLA